MGLFQDQESGLPLLQRLVARLKDATRRRELSPGDWTTAMTAYALQMSEDPALLTEGLEAYADFAQIASASERQASLSRLAQFVMQRRGAGWRALLLYAMGEAEHAELCARAASFAVSLAPHEEPLPFAGAQALVELLATHEDAPAAMLDGLLLLPDARLLSCTEPLYSLPTARMRSLLSGMRSPLNSLSSAFLLRLVEGNHELADAVTDALVRMAANTPLVADIAMPIPTWAFRNPTPQPLHAWSLPEFLPRILPRLLPLLSPQQVDALRAAFV